MYRELSEYQFIHVLCHQIMVIFAILILDIV